MRPVICVSGGFFWRTLIVEGDRSIDTGYVCPLDVKKMLLQQARKDFCKRWAAKHEYGFDAQIFFLKKRRKIGLKNIEMLRGSYLWKEVGCRNGSSTLVGRMNVSAELATGRQALKITGSNSVVIRSKCCCHVHLVDLEVTAASQFILCCNTGLGNTKVE